MADGRVKVDFPPCNSYWAFSVFLIRISYYNYYNLKLLLHADVWRKSVYELQGICKGLSGGVELDVCPWVWPLVEEYWSFNKPTLLFHPSLFHSHLRLQDEINLRLEAESNLSSYRQVRWQNDKSCLGIMERKYKKSSELLPDLRW